MRSLAISTLTGPAADFLLRIIEHTQAVTLNQIKDVMKQRYSDLSDVLYARRSLRGLVQTKRESVQNFGERIIAAARGAYPGQDLNDPTIQGHLVENFASGLRSPGIMKLILRKRPADLDRAIIIGAGEQHASKSFELNQNFRQEEDMDDMEDMAEQSDLDNRWPCTQASPYNMGAV